MSGQQGQQKTLNYMQHKQKKQGGGQNTTSNGQSHTNNQQTTSGRQFTRLKPDATSHVPPIAMYILGGLGILVGIGTNVWQWFTTFSAMMMLMTPDQKHYNKSSEPLKYVVAAIIATAMQFGILLLIFKVDNKWKRNTYSARPQGAGEVAQSYAVAFVEVVQHIDVVSAYGIIAFAIDTFGDYTFIAGILNGMDFATTVFITFLYAAGLYCLSTIVFVRCIEYLGAGLAATARTIMGMQGKRNN